MACRMRPMRGIESGGILSGWRATLSLSIKYFISSPLSVIFSLLERAESSSMCFLMCSIKTVYSRAYERPYLAGGRAGFAPKSEAYSQKRHRVAASQGHYLAHARGSKKREVRRCDSGAAVGRAATHFCSRRQSVGFTGVFAPKR